MALVQAKCPNCGANLQIDNEKDAAICPYCNTAYIVEKAIANFYNSKVDCIVAETVNIYGYDMPEKEPETQAVENTGVAPGLIEKLNTSVQFKNAIQRTPSKGELCDGNILFLKSDGTLGYDGQRWTFDPKIFLWKNIKKFNIVQVGDYKNPYDNDRWISVYGVVALTFDGRFLVSDPGEVYVNGKKVVPANRFDSIRAWSGIEDFCYDGIRILALTKQGTVKTTDTKEDVSSWSGISKIGGYPGAFYGIRADGSVCVCGRFKNYQKEIISTWKDITHIDHYYSYDYIVGLTANGKILSVNEGMNPWEAYNNIVHFENDVAICADGTAVDRSGEMIGWRKGYIYATLPNPWKVRLFLGTDGKVDATSDTGIAEGVISICNNEENDKLFVKGDGTFESPFGNGKRRIFNPDHMDSYGKTVSEHIDDSRTKQILNKIWNEQLRETENNLKACGLFDKRKALIKEEQEYVKRQLEIVNTI